MTDASVTALITAIPPTLAACTAIAVGVINIFKSNEIHLLVNSQLTRVQANLVLAEKRILVLEAALVNK